MLVRTPTLHNKNWTLTYVPIQAGEGLQLCPVSNLLAFVDTKWWSWRDNCERRDKPLRLPDSRARSFRPISACSSSCLPLMMTLAGAGEEFDKSVEPEKRGIR
ncbi:hypothetical protein TIFTF001_025274 [Ficus carica]|uniref:Uncharacterized protein n=1 Tax=Ficus carica TaxID=3494 RepID=A0AA88AMQ0_FICCA|nr:hypothetical protein TIFTF001_025274 [Ficus carica]